VCAGRLDAKVLTGDEHWDSLSSAGLIDATVVIFPRA
jgi:hypothetical protein